MSKLTDWQRGDKISAAHLNQAWMALRQFLPITAGPGVQIHSNAMGGTTISAQVTHDVVETIDAKIVAHGDADTPFWFDPRYFLQAGEVSQDPSSDVDDSPNIIADDNYTVRAPGDQFMAFNLAEMLWGSHYLHVGDWVSAHKIHTSMDGTPGQTWTWWVFSRNPDPIRSAIVQETPDTCNNIVSCLDEYQTLASGTNLTEVTLAENVPVSGSDQLVGPSGTNAGTSIHYIPASGTNGFIVGYFVEPAGGTCCDANSFGTNTVTTTNTGHADLIPAMRGFYANPDEFAFVPASSDGTGCLDVAGLRWKGFDVQYWFGGTSTICGAQILQFGQSVPTTTNIQKVDFTIGGGTASRCASICGTGAASALITGQTYQCTTSITYGTGEITATATASCDPDTGDITISITIDEPTATTTVVIPC